MPRGDCANTEVRERSSVLKTGNGGAQNAFYTREMATSSARARLVDLTTRKSLPNGRDLVSGTHRSALRNLGLRLHHARRDWQRRENKTEPSSDPLARRALDVADFATQAQQ